MPLYDFRCEDCQTVFEVKASIKDHEAGLPPPAPLMPLPAAASLL